MAGSASRGKRNIHFVGIGGIGMSGLARIMRAKGYRVSGTDLGGSPLLDGLSRAGISVRIGHGSHQIPRKTGLVVHSAAIGATNPELREAHVRALPVARYSQVLGSLMREKIGVAVAGTHGKSTTSAMTAHILKRAGFDPTYLIGGMVPDLDGNAGLGYGVHFVAEACEYAASFHDLQPEVAVLTNIEADHLDYYGSFPALKRAFETFLKRLPPHGRVVANAEDMDVMSAVVNAAPCPVTTFGLHVPACFRGEDLEERRGRYRFRLVRDGREAGLVKLLVPGYHNVKNGLAAAGAAAAAGASSADIVKGLSTFRGVERRFQVIARVHGITVVNDYSHHPTEIRALLSTARKSYPNARILCVFQPHQGSRTRYLLEDFARAFVLADFVVVPEIYFVRDAFAERALVSSKNLVGRMRDLGVDGVFVPSFDRALAEMFKRVERGDVLLTVGAGPVGELPGRILKRLEKERRSRFMRVQSPVWVAQPEVLPASPASGKALVGS